jgi:hydroxyacid-oxoacid transhydrogenase
VKGLEAIFTMNAARIKFGKAATREVGLDAVSLGIKRALIVTDQALASSECVGTVREGLGASSVDSALFSGVEIEPSDRSVREAIAFARDGHFDGYIAVGGGSTIDTAKLANLGATNPGNLYTYVVRPVGNGLPVPGALCPLIAIPSTAGSGSEVSGVAIFHDHLSGFKAAVADPALQPDLAILDPDNTRSAPSMVTACSGWDTLCAGLEAYTALPFDRRPAPERPEQRPAYQGASPLSDVWAERTILLASRNLARAVQDSTDDEARSNMLLAACMGSMASGNAGVHLAHAMSYPVSGLSRGYRPAGYPAFKPLVPHGMAVALSAPAALRFTAGGRRQRHLDAARIMGAPTHGSSPDEAGSLLYDALIHLLQATGMPNGLSALGIEPSDGDQLVRDALHQQRVIHLVPRRLDAADLRQLYLEAMVYW